VTGGSAIVLGAPELGDELVRLRPWRLDDAPALAAAWNDSAIVAGSMPPDERTQASATRWIEGWELRRSTGVALDMVVADPTDDRVVGEIGLSRFDGRRRAAMIGWWVAAPERGRGIATRAVRTVVDWVLDPERLDAVLAEIDGTNLASAHVALNAGFVELRPAADDHAAVYACASTG
jgi:RimJ/RimL family protein N-acetyltransferase